MFGSPKFCISPLGGTKKNLVFYRLDPVEDARGEIRPAKRDTAWVEADVAPGGSRGIMNQRLAEMYRQMYSLIIPGSWDIRPQDRCMVDGAECIVETVANYSSHMELEIGARESSKPS